MSTKSTKKAPKLPPMEAIVTRNRSAQLRRQLRNSDQSMKKIFQITNLLRSPTRAEMATVKSPKKHQESKKVNKSPKVTQKSQKKIVNGNEFYPNKLKRMVKAKKVLLKPKHEMKSIAVGVSKRKLCVPQKETKSSSPKRMRTEPQPRHSELSIMELVRMSDESETLNDEDLMEILTCESPVWWEDPPDEGYIEDPICLRDEAIEETHSDQSWSLEKGRNNKVKPKMYKAKHYNTETGDNSVKQLESKKTDDKFMKKRSKLENLLSNIKNKLNTESNQISGLVTNNKESTDTVDNFDKDKSIVMKVNEIDKTNDEANVNERVTNKNSAESNTNMEQMSRKNKSQSESEGEDIFSGFRDDAILRNLENMDIPIGEINNGCEDSSLKNVRNPKCTLNSDNDSVPVNTSVDNTHVKSEDAPVKIENKPFKVEDVTLPACSYTESKDLKMEFDRTEQEMPETWSTELNYIEISSSNTVKDENHTAVNEDSCKNESLDKDLKDHVTDISNPSKDPPDDIPTTLPILLKNPINNIEKITASPISVKSVISEDCYETSSLVSNPDGMDTISDTNIHFIDDDDSSKHSEESLRETEKIEAVKDNVDEIKETSEIDMSLSKVEGNDDKINLDSEKPKSSASNPLKVKLVYSSVPKSKEYMTVYKIITGDNMDLDCKETEVKPDKGTEVLASKAAKDMKCYEKVEFQNGNLNSFFKICKNSYQRRPRKLETIVSDTQKLKSTQNQHKKDTTETILVSNTNNVKYCRKCSSIFDTEICGYCNKKETHESSGSTVDKQYSCDLCEFRSSCKSAIVQHVTDHD